MVDARSHRKTGTHFSGSRFSKPGILARNDASSDRHPALSILFEHDLRANAYRVCPEGKPVATFPDHTPGALSPPKRKPGQNDRAHLTRCSAIYSENAKKQWFVWHLVSRISGKKAHLAAFFREPKGGPGRRAADLSRRPGLTIQGGPGRCAGLHVLRIERRRPE